MWFMEEVGELSAALRSGDKPELAAEFADVLAWLATLANIAGVDLDAAVRAKYGGGCPGCGKSPCACCPGGETMNREQGTGNREQKMRETPLCWFVRSPRRIRRFYSFLLAFLFCSLFPVPCSLFAAESPPHIEKVQVGLPGGQAEQESARSRNGAWAPVYVKLKAGPEGNARDRFRIRVETTDSENTVYHYDSNLPALVPNQDYLAVAYIRPGGAGSDFTIQLQTASGQNLQGVPPVAREADKETLDPKDVLYLTIGVAAARHEADAAGRPRPGQRWRRRPDRQERHHPLRLHGRRAADARPLVRLRRGGCRGPRHRQQDVHQFPQRRFGRSAAQGPCRVGAPRRQTRRFGRRQPPDRRRGPRQDAAAGLRQDAAAPLRHRGQRDRGPDGPSFALARR